MSISDLIATEAEAAERNPDAPIKRAARSPAATSVPRRSRSG